MSKVKRFKLIFQILFITFQVVKEPKVLCAFDTVVIEYLVSFSPNTDSDPKPNIYPNPMGPGIL